MPAPCAPLVGARRHVSGLRGKTGRRGHGGLGMVKLVEVNCHNPAAQRSAIKRPSRGRLSDGRKEVSGLSSDRWRGQHRQHHAKKSRREPAACPCHVPFLLFLLGPGPSTLRVARAVFARGHVGLAGDGLVGGADVCSAASAASRSMAVTGSSARIARYLGTLFSTGPPKARMRSR